MPILWFFGVLWFLLGWFRGSILVALVRRRRTFSSAGEGGRADVLRRPDSDG